MQSKSKEIPPVLVVFFNRPKNLAKLLPILKKSGIGNVYFASDGPRDESDLRLIDESWKLIFSYFPKLDVDRILRRKNNLGCRIAVSESISWFFKKVDMGMILEDDCIPSEDFFTVMSDALIELSSDERVFCVNGTNPLPNTIRNRRPYLSHYPQIWGWGTWADRWNLYKRDFSDSEQVIEKILRTHWLNGVFMQPIFFRWIWQDLLGRAGNAQIDTWDYSMLATMWRNSMYAVQLSGNYVLNIGFDADATHTYHQPVWAPSRYEEGTEIYDNQLVTDNKLDLWLSEHVYGCNATQSIKLPIRNILRKVGARK